LDIVPYVGHVNAGIVIRVNINVDLSQLRRYMQVGNDPTYFLQSLRQLASVTS